MDAQFVAMTAEKNAENIEEVEFFEEPEIEDFEYDEDVTYEVTCPTCGEVLQLDEETILGESTNCPKCNEFLEFDFDEIEE